MGKKFAKFLLFVSTVGAAFAGAYYFMKSKKSSPAEEDDYEDLDDDSEEDSDKERSYVSLNSDKDTSERNAAKEEAPAGAKVEELFDDEDDDSDGSLDAI